MKANARYTSEFHAQIEALDGDVKGRRDAYDFMSHSAAIYHDELIKYVCTPKFFNRESYQVLSSTLSKIHTILCKVIVNYISNPAYRSIFDFDQKMVDLILLPRGYDAVLPFARFDIFFDEDNLNVRFCEFNADGSSGMNENREVSQALSCLEGFQLFSSNHVCTPCELHESWIDELISIYATYEKRVDQPRMAICDFLDHAVIDEFRTYAQLFQKRGIECEVCDIRDLEYRDGALFGKNDRQIDVIWRRSVTNDILENWEDSQPLLDAVRDKNVALIGSFAGHIVHDKQIFMALCHPDTLEFLDEEEQEFLSRTIPFTCFLDAQDEIFEKAKKEKDKWIIKPTDNYGATDVYAGLDFDSDAWHKLLEAHASNRMGQRFLLQEYCAPFKTLTLPPDNDIQSLSDEEVCKEPVPYNNLTGLYSYNGKFAGVFSRLGPNSTISAAADGVTAASLWVD